MAKATKSLAPVFIRLLEDNEPEVRRASAKNLNEYAEAAPKELNDCLVPKLKEHLTKEKEDKVKAELVAEAVKLFGKMKSEDSAEVILCVLNMLNDSSLAAKQAVLDHLPIILPVSHVTPHVFTRS